jgi:hypothetical protein
MSKQKSGSNIPSCAESAPASIKIRHKTATGRIKKRVCMYPPKGKDEMPCQTWSCVRLSKKEEVVRVSVGLFMISMNDL